ncbi:hypothetical protein [Cryptosporangium sp. NPDC051539]|uniref:hypothetical protein n=1 Tax=Cryptosporangium sp. NPDC051539 TaxID=3363962 RepID=UPI0037B4E009
MSTMISDASVRPPAPTIVAIVLLAILPVRLAFVTVGEVVGLDPWVAVPIVFLGLWTLLIVRLWRGGRIAYAFAVVATAFTIMSALTTALAPLVPELDDTGEIHGFVDTVPSITGLALALAVLALLVGSRQSRLFFAAGAGRHK